MRHSLKVNQLAMFLGKKLKDKGEDVNLELLEVSSLLHDVGKLLGDKIGSHITAGCKILNERGLPDIANIIKKHPIYAILNEDTTPKTWEEKLVFYADRRVMEDKIVSLDERTNDHAKRKPKIKKILPKVLPKIKKLEDEIFNIIGIEKDIIL